MTFSRFALGYVAPEIWSSIVKDKKYNRISAIENKLSNVVKSYLMEISALHITSRVNCHSYDKTIYMTALGNDVNLNIILMSPTTREIFDRVLNKYRIMLESSIHANITASVDVERQCLHFHITRR